MAVLASAPLERERRLSEGKAIEVLGHDLGHALAQRCVRRLDDDGQHVIRRFDPRHGAVVERNACVVGVEFYGEFM
jgi:hypothetical protein